MKNMTFDVNFRVHFRTDKAGLNVFRVHVTYNFNYYRI